LTRPIRAPRVTKAQEICQIDSLAEFPSAFSRLAEMLGHPGKMPPSGEVEFLRSNLNGKKRHEGTIAPSDYFFLTAFISILEPRRVIEIGTLTGFSAGIIAAALARQPKLQGDRRVDTIDILSQCLIDESRPTGFEIAETFPEFASLIHLHAPRDSTVIGELADRDELELAFIDANHSHPLPLLDLLRLAPCMRGGGWILLHDIKLGTLCGKTAEVAQTSNWKAPFGAEWLFDYWPYRKISGGNIGAVQLPEDKSELIQFSLFLMSMPFELGGEGRIRRELYQSLGPLIAQTPG
jgi:predicted O-methyltransferase YrrM